MKRILDYRVSNKTNKTLILIERFHGAFEKGHRLNPKFVTSLKKTTIITSSGASTRIEGAILTDAQIKEFLDKGCKISKMSSRSEREVAGYVKALYYIYDNFAELEISEKNIRQLHQVLTSELSEDQLPKKQRGAYKDITNHVVEKNLQTGKEIIWFKTTPPGPQTEAAMSSLINFFNVSMESDEVAPLILTAAFIVHFLAIHPFRDGNGRLSRLLTIWILLRFGYEWMQFASHEKVIEDNKERYYLALRETQNSFNKSLVKYDPWIDFFCDIIFQQTQIIDALLKKESPVSSMNQNEVVVYEILKSNGKCNIGFILEQVEMTRAGLKTLLKRMLESGHIKSKGAGKATVYYV
jgi:Fic family protein